MGGRAHPDPQVGRAKKRPATSTGTDFRRVLEPAPVGTAGACPDQKCTAFGPVHGHPPAGPPAFEEFILRVSPLAEEAKEIGEIDLNPIFAFTPGAGCRTRVRPER